MGIRHTWHHSISFIMYKDHHTQWAGQCLHHHLELSSPVLLDFILIAWLHSIETPRATMLCTELNDEVAFDGLFSNYGNSSHQKYGEIIQKCWRKRCSHLNLSYSWRNVTVQKSKLHQTAQVIIATARRLCHHRAWKQWRKPQKEASAQPPQPGQKEEECWKQYKDAINSSCHSITGSQRTRAMSRDTPLFILAKR